MMTTSLASAGASNKSSSIDSLLQTDTRVLKRQIAFVPAVHPKARSNLMVNQENVIPINLTTTTTTKQQQLLQRKQTQQPVNPAQPVASDFEEAKVSLYDFDRAVRLMKWRQSTRVGSGLRNLGNTCYLNSVLQSLMYTPALVNYLLYEMGQSDNHHCPTGSFCMLCALKDLITASRRKQVVAPQQIVRHLRVISKRFRVGRQEDAHEFTRCLIEYLQTNCLGKYVKLKDDKVKETSVIYRIFGGYFRSQVVCHECKRVSNKYDAFMDLELEINGCATLDKALSRFARTERLDDDNKYMCDQCKHKVVATKTLRVFRAPLTLTVLLKRFMFGGMSKKLDRHVQFNETLQLDRYTCDPKQPHTYRLYAVVVHHGYSQHSGHYVAYVKNANGIWYEMNDSTVRQVSVQAVLAQKAYMLFYSRDQREVVTKPTTMNGHHDHHDDDDGVDVNVNVDDEKKMIDEDESSSEDEAVTIAKRQATATAAAAPPPPPVEPMVMVHPLVAPMWGAHQCAFASLWGPFLSNLTPGITLLEGLVSERHALPTPPPTPSPPPPSLSSSSSSVAVNTLVPRSKNIPITTTTTTSVTNGGRNNVFQRFNPRMSVNGGDHHNVDQWEDVDMTVVHQRQQFERSMAQQHKRRRDSWDEELDAGHRRKVKQRRQGRLSGNGNGGNLFQRYHNGNQNSHRQNSNNNNHHGNNRHRGRGQRR